FLYSEFGFAETSRVYRIEIRGTINPATSRYLARSLEQAEQEQADFLLIELDTPGGLVTSVREMAQTIEQSKIPVVVFTMPAGAAATSAGALLMISAHVAVMAPGTNIGAAHPVGAQGENIDGAMGEKAVNDVAAFARSMAELRKRNVNAASEIVSKSKSYSAEEALREKLIDLIAADKISLWTALHNREVQVGAEKNIFKTDPAPTIQSLEMTLGEKILNSLSHPNVAAILMTLAILLIYSELSAPGLGLAGILGGLCLIVGFIAFQALPIQMGGLVLLGLGVLLIVSEVLVGSGGVLAFGGSIALVLGFLWVVDPTESDLRISPWLIGGLGVTLASGTLVIGYGVSRIKKQTFETHQRIGGGDSAGVSGYRGSIREVASDGKSGKVFIRGELWSFVSQEPLKENDKVVVQGSRGLVLEVIRKKE
ncbi:MAG: nodulation protein NfeD, partial [Pseudobdellovibrionaceae bacterium]